MKDTAHTTDKAPGDDDQLRAAARMLLDELDIPQQPEFQGHAMVMIHALALLWSKRDYGTSWRRTGYMGTTLKLDMKMTRLMNLVWWRSEGTAPALLDESIGDTFLDMINYSVFGYQQWCNNEVRKEGRP